ncbi:MAG: hypothetical protein DMG70_31310 [Acidobacteria bacterium]|nr:MAG: hypothetical protein DMG70_31310 [Acidobacteriota bacterium]PYY07936.1 MAG: hypothetical protein DMG69_17540 [Acidobacteriota bacterium]
MSSHAQERQTLSSVPELSSLYATYGVEVNALSVEQIFALYERTGFLYPDKAARLRPHLGLVRDNWRKMLRAGESLLYILTAGDERRGMASLAVWRAAPHGWMPQHLVSDNNPFASRAVMLAAAAARMLRGVDDAQNWFRPENRFPARVFGSMVQTIGESLCSVQRHSFFALPKGLNLSVDSKIHAVPYDPAHKQALSAIASATRGSVYIAGEDLLGDVELRTVNDIYRSVGLRRTRSVWLAFKGTRSEPVGAAIAFRGPLGINFSFLENRCDLLLHPTLPVSEVPDTVACLLSASAAAYRDFELNEIPLIADEMATDVLLKLGAEFLRHYCQGIWLQAGHQGFYQHVNGFYSRLLARAEKQKMKRSRAASESR